MKVVLCGSGSGGHITPLLAVAKQLKNTDHTTKVIYIGEKNGKYNQLVNDPIFDETYFLPTGKFRRYYKESFLVRLFDFKTNILNLRDMCLILVGVIKGLKLLKTIKPDVVFMKGGSISIPVGIGAKFAGIPVVTHDSDAVPGVSNRIGGRYAVLHTTALPIDNYSYAKKKCVEVGLPIDPSFRQYTEAEIRILKEKYSLPKNSFVLLVTGGSGGAARLNKWTNQILSKLIENNTNLYVFFITGKGKVVKNNYPRVKVIEFTNEMYHLCAIADLIITRAGATTLAEFAAAKKPLLVVPNPDLTGGHQIKNAESYKSIDSIEVITEQTINQSIDNYCNEVQDLINNKNRRDELANNIHRSIPKTPAAISIAQIILDNNHGSKK